MAACSSDGGGGAKSSSNLSFRVGASADQLRVVDCLLPGQIRKIGAQATYVSRPRPTRTSAADCEIRGGEYVAYDRANYATALKVWLESAESGDEKAQFYVGEIYEKGLGTAPNYAEAAKWYRRAAEQGYKPAQINLGFLYEEGLGVPRDSAEALRWYRRASGLKDTDIALAPEPSQSASEQTKDRAAADALRNQLAQAREQLSRARQESERLRREIEATRAKEQAARVGTQDDLDRQRQEFETERAQLEAKIGVLTAEIDDKNRQLEEARQQPPAEPRGTRAPDENQPSPAIDTLDVQFGDFHALVIGNNDYQRIKDLETAVADAKAIGNLLASKYGFTVTTLMNATNEEIRVALYRMNEIADEDDNLLVYYAGHGYLEDIPERRFKKGYWIPVDGDQANRAKWISNTEITDFIWTARAQHVLVVADSCYSGALFRTAQSRLKAGSTPKAQRAWIEARVSQVSRHVFSSGGLQPVLDTSGGEHSIFAQAFLDVLTENSSVIDGESLSKEVATRVTYAAQAYDVTQIPQYGPIHHAAHAGGEFFLVPAAKAIGHRSGNEVLFAGVPPPLQ